MVTYVLVLCLTVHLCKRYAVSGILSFRQPLRGCHLPRQRKVNRFADAQIPPQRKRYEKALPRVPQISAALGVNAIACHGYNPSVFSACKTSRKASSPCTGEPRTHSVYPQQGGRGSSQSRRLILNRRDSSPCKQGELSACRRFHRGGSRGKHAACFAACTITICNISMDLYGKWRFFAEFGEK